MPLSMPAPRPRSLKDYPGVTRARARARRSRQAPVGGPGAVAGEGGRQDRLHRVQTVLGLIEDDRVRRFEHLVGDFEAVETVASRRCVGPIAVPPSWNAGRQCRNLTSGLPVASSARRLTWKTA